MFYPYMPSAAVRAAARTLRGRWVGQGRQVDEFERQFEAAICPPHVAVAVGSGTDALHLAYLLAGIGCRDEVIAPVFTCVATNMPLLYLRARIRFADVQPGSLNIDPNHVRALVSDRTAAIVCTHYGGLPCDMDELRRIAAPRGIPIIEDAAHALGALYRGHPVGGLSDFTCFSFQAVKHITTADGGMLTLRDRALADRARRLRWFGIDRAAKQSGTWDHDIREIGYKYQMTDVAAALGKAGLADLPRVLRHRRALLAEYGARLRRVPGVRLIGSGYRDRRHAAWLCSVEVEHASDLQRRLAEAGIESAPVHYRNDSYTVFKASRGDFPHMDALDHRYLVLPLHMRLTLDDVRFICDVIRRG